MKKRQALWVGIICQSSVFETKEYRTKMLLLHVNLKFEMGTMARLPFLYILNKITDLYTYNCPLLQGFCIKICLNAHLFCSVFPWLVLSSIRSAIGQVKIRPLIIRPLAATYTLTHSAMGMKKSHIKNLNGHFFKNFRFYCRTSFKTPGLFVCNTFHFCSILQIKIFHFHS